MIETSMLVGALVLSVVCNILWVLYNSYNIGKSMRLMYQKEQELKRCKMELKVARK